MAADPNNDDSIQRLECEDGEERFHRINTILAALDSRGAPRSSINPLLAQTSSEISGTQTAQLLERVQAFLPQLQAANQSTQSQARENPASVDIETFDGTEESYIQLSLGLGLFEQRQAGLASGDASSSSESNTSNEEESSSSSSSDEDDSSSEDEDDDPQPDLIALVTGTRPMRPLPTSRHPTRTEGHPGIVILGSLDTVSDIDHVEE